MHPFSTMNHSVIMSPSHNATSLPLEALSSAAVDTITAPKWMVEFVDFRKRLFLQTVEPVIVTLLGPARSENTQALEATSEARSLSLSAAAAAAAAVNSDHRRLTSGFDYFMPDYVEDPYAYRETSMSFATLTMLFLLMGCILVIFLSCFYHNQKTSPLFISPRRHRLPKLVPPPLPIDGYFDWVR